MLIAGSAGVVKALVTLVRLKVLAFYLGPAGIGIYGILVNLLRVAAKITGCGISFAAVRQIADHSGSPARQSDDRWGVLLFSVCAGAIGGAVIWAISDTLADDVY